MSLALSRAKCFASGFCTLVSQDLPVVVILYSQSRTCVDALDPGPIYAQPYHQCSLSLRTRERLVPSFRVAIDAGLQRSDVVECQEGIHLVK